MRLRAEAPPPDLASEGNSPMLLRLRRVASRHATHVTRLTSAPPCFSSLPLLGRRFAVSQRPEKGEYSTLRERGRGSDYPLITCFILLRASVAFPSLPDVYVKAYPPQCTCRGSVLSAQASRGGPGRYVPQVRVRGGGGIYATQIRLF